MAAIRRREARPFDRAVEDDELLAQQEIFSEQLRFAAYKIGDCAKDWAMRNGLGPA
ncbi:MAG: hypothetical protein NVS2B7_05250 [Herpetosiphon sp.]